MREHFAGFGPIPADAGEPLQSSMSWIHLRAYPRGRGGARRCAAIGIAMRGLSPRTRGSPVGRRAELVGRGPIPADAGEPSARTGGSCSRRAYPRGRGGASGPRDGDDAPVGLSPRTRGSRRVPVLRWRWRGPIPADAGEPSRSTARICTCWAYPRGRGGAEHVETERSAGEGLSPRTRGSRAHARAGALGEGPIPADAGEPRGSLGEDAVLGAYPRGRGGARWPPRESGGQGAYPRGRGGAMPVDAPPPPAKGLSPRTRGSRPQRLARLLHRGPIPADAGEPPLQ